MKATPGTAAQLAGAELGCAPGAALFPTGAEPGSAQGAALFPTGAEPGCAPGAALFPTGAEPGSAPKAGSQLAEGTVTSAKQEAWSQKWLFSLLSLLAFAATAC